MESNIKEEINVVNEIQRQKDVMLNINAITEKILGIVRGNPVEECESMQDENCMLDTLKNNRKILAKLERNINELANKIIG